MEILDQLLLPVVSKYVPVRGVEDGWKVINKMQVSPTHSAHSNQIKFKKQSINQSLSPLKCRL